MHDASSNPPDHWQRVQQLFDRALQIPPDARAAFLDSACADDPDLRAELDSLLAHHERAATGFLTGPAARGGATDAAPADSLIGTRIGRYHIDAVIAAGGMGTVYRATQDAPRRTVALKLLRPGWYSPSAIRRFDYESQLLAALRHPHIAAVYEAGTADHLGGIPYFAMEYVPDAAPITDYADARNLSTRDRLALFTQVCDAVAHGHTKGIIHRDLKPANILVDDAGSVKVIDFGVARATDADVAATTLHTDVGQLVGTLQYMSPEQCDADPHAIDARADVYSLGIVLYELLTGELPYDVSGTLLSAARTIRDEPPRRLSLINRRLRGDVEAIALKALEKNRDRRYQSAADLRADIDRYLRREPVSARPPTILADIIRWSLRHPKTATTTVCLALAAFILATATTLAWYANTKPWRVEIVGDEREVRLLSFMGRPIDYLRFDDRVVAGAEMVEAPPELGGGMLMIVGVSPHADGPYGGKLCAFRVETGFRDPVWTRQVKTEEIPAALQAKRDYRGEQSGVGGVMIADVFPGDAHPGEEIVATHHLAPWSPCAIRVYNRQGDLLYEVWHDGVCKFAYWMKDPGLLVVQGCESGIEWADLGCMNIRTPHLFTVFAVRPKPGVRSNGFINVDPTLRAEHVLWDRFLVPPESSDLVDGPEEYLRVPLDRRYNTDSCVQLCLPVPARPDLKGDLAWVIDEHGNEVPGSRVIGDSLRQPWSTIDPSIFRLATREELPALCAEQAD